MSFTVAILGRPNVGKSTLFNRLVGKRLALVDETPGVTRDWRQGEGRLGHLTFTVLDTAGLGEAAADSLEARMRAQTEAVLDQADLALMLIDARDGVTPMDEHFTDWLRRREVPVLLVANKCEGEAGRAGLYEAYGLGLGEPIAVSAEHGEGMTDLLDALLPFAGAVAPEMADEEAPLQFAIIGRPNVGKSTLVNRLIGRERVITGPEPGITRDAIAIEWAHRGQRVRLIDTAGLRRRARVTEKLEKLSTADALRAIRFAQVVVLAVDATEPLNKQDLAIAATVAEEGRALVIAANKWDIVADRRAAKAGLRERLEDSLPQLGGVPLVTVSALTGYNLSALIDAAFEAYRVWNQRVPTGRLNRWLAEVVEAHPPPMAAGRRVKLRYLTQAKTRPPTFIIFANRPQALPESYRRYLRNGLRRAFDLDGVPLRLYLRKGENPYA
ncbi:MAG: ribosome biogenesis GTPase Der [Kiloniellales bacterium]